MDNKNKDKAKKDVQLYQWLYIVPFSIVAWVGMIAVAIVAILIFVCAAKYLVASFMLDSAKIFPAIVLTLISLCVVAVLVLSEIILIKKYLKSIKDFLKEKEQIMSDSEKSEQ